MDTTDRVLLIILTTLLSVFFVLCIAAVVIVIKLLKEVRLVIAKAEDVVDSVESATEVLRHTGDRVALFKLIKTIFKLAQKGRK